MSHAGGRLTALRQINELADRFEAELAAGRRPAIEKFLQEAGTQRAEMLRELIISEADWRRKAGERVSIDDYVGRFPELSAEQVSDLLMRSSDARLGTIVIRDRALAARAKGVGSSLPAVPPQRSATTDLNLLFAVLAVQADLVTRDALVEAMAAWAIEKQTPLSQILLRHGAIDADGAELISALVKKHLAKHDDDVGASLAAMSDISPSARAALALVPDCDVQASIVRLASSSGHESTLIMPRTSETRYRVLRPHARGGLGEVFVARDEEVGRDVALKQIQTWAADDPEARTRFLLEAEVTGGLEHPGIVPLYGMGIYADGRPFYAMRFVRGDTLKEAIARYHAADGQRQSTSERNVAFRDLLRRFVDVCRTISYAHSRGVLHRDIKPGNVMLGRYGETLMVDWGLAKVVGRPDPVTSPDAEATVRTGSGSNATPTRAGSVVGTLGYMSPEQAEGRLEELGPASDVYGLGATLYHLLTGRPPFEGRDLAVTLQKVRTGDFSRPREVSRSVAKALEAVCLKAMAVRPSDRYESAASLAIDVELFLADEPVGALPESSVQKASRWWRRHRRANVVALASAVLIAVVSVAAVGLIKKALEQAEAAADLSRQRLVRAHVGRGVAALDAQDPFAALPWFAEALRHEKREADAERPHRLRLALTMAQVPRLERLIGPEHGLFSPDGRWFAAGHTVYPYESWRPMANAPWGHTADGFAFSPDGRLLAALSDGQVWLWNLTEGRPGPAVESAGVTPRSSQMVDGSLKFDNRGRRLFAIVRDRGSVAGGEPQLGDTRLHVWELSSGKLAAPSVVLPAAAPEGAVVAPDGLKFRMPPSQEIMAAEGRLAMVALQLDAAAGVGPRVYIWDVDAGTFRRSPVAPDHGSRVWLSPDGSHGVIVDANRERVAPIDLQTGLASAELPRVPPRVGAVAFDAAGSRVAIAGAEGVGVWELEKGNLVRPPIESELPVRAVAFSQDGQQLVTGTGDGVARVWDVDSGEQMIPAVHANGRIVRVSLSPDGTRLVLDVSSPEPRIQIWNIRTIRSGYDVESDLSDSTDGVIRSGDGSRVVAVGPSPAVVDLAAEGAHVRPLPHRPGQWTDLSAGGGRLALVDAGKLFIYDARVLEPMRAPIEVGQGRVRLVGSGNRATVEDGRTVSLWDVDTGGRIGSVDVDSRWADALNISPDGRQFFPPSIEPTIVDIATGRRTTLNLGQEFHPDRSTRFVSAFSPSSDRLALWLGAGPVLIYASDRPVPLSRAQVDGDVSALVFDAAALRLAILAGGTVQVWSVATATPVSPPIPITGTAKRIAFAGRGEMLLTVSSAGARLWRLPDGQPLSPWLRNGASELFDAWTSPEGERLVTADRTGLRVWDLRPDDRLAGDIALHAELIAGAKVDSTGALVSLSAESAATRFNRLSVLFPSEFGLSSDAAEPAAIPAAPSSSSTSQRTPPRDSRGLMRGRDALPQGN